MKAALAHAYGPPRVISIGELPRPVPGPGDILIAVHASTVASGDVRIRAFDVPWAMWLPFRLATGLLRPRNPVLGVEFAGTVIAAGARVTRFDPGDRVYGYNMFGCHAEFKAMPATGCVARMPANMSFAEAASVPHGALAALHFLRRAGIAPGKRVAINGAAGAVGVFAVQLARHFGAHVTGICGPRHADLVRSLGADRVIDYTAQDVTRGDQVFDIILDTVSKLPFRRSRAVLAPRGVHVYLLAGAPQLALWLWTSLRGGKRVIGGVAPEPPAMLDELRGLIEAGTLKTVIDRRYPLDRIAEAHAYVDTGHKAGSVVIDIARGGDGPAAPA